MDMYFDFLDKLINNGERQFCDAHIFSNNFPELAKINLPPVKLRFLFLKFIRLFLQAFLFHVIFGGPI